MVVVVGYQSQILSNFFWPGFGKSTIMIFWSVSSLLQVCPDIIPSNICGHHVQNSFFFCMCRRWNYSTILSNYFSNRKGREGKVCLWKGIVRSRELLGWKDTQWILCYIKRCNRDYSTQYKDFEEVKEMLKSSNKAIRAWKQREDLLDERKFYTFSRHLKHGGRGQCQYIFTSEADKKRHTWQIHSGTGWGRKKAQPQSKLMLNVLFAVNYILPDTSYKCTKINKIINWERVDQKRNKHRVYNNMYIADMISSCMNYLPTI